jgi:hypothetical protein
MLEGDREVGYADPDAGGRVRDAIEERLAPDPLACILAERGAYAAAETYALGRSARRERGRIGVSRRVAARSSVSGFEASVRDAGLLGQLAYRATARAV